MIEKIVLFDIVGKKIKELSGTVTEISVMELQNGIYVLQITSEKQTHTLKFIKK